MKIVAYLEPQHSSHCAVLDPTPSRCDCGARPVPLVTEQEARTLLNKNHTNYLEDFAKFKAKISELEKRLAAQPSHAQGEAFQQGRAAGIEEAAKLWDSIDGKGKESHISRAIRALAAKNGEGKS